MSDSAPHIPVMLAEVLEVLSPVNGETFIDGTLGAGGYSRAILGSARDVRVLGIDRDPAVVSGLAGKVSGLEVVHGRFGELDVLAAACGYEKVDGVVLDIGVSSMQIDDPARGFSFRFDGPLDMRMDNSGTEMSAADLVGSAGERELEEIFRKLGQERYARKVAAAIVRERATEKIVTTGRLAEIIRSVVPKSKADLQDPATRCFQALRIAVNDELGELRRGLEAAERVLSPGGRLVVVSFHSLEDGLVKDFMLDRSGNKPRASRHMPVGGAMEGEAAFRLLSKKAIQPSEEEIRRNPRARSARLRVAVRTRTPAAARSGGAG